MVYVNNQDEAREFWTEKVGFQVVAEERLGDMRWIEVAPAGAETSIVLHNKEWVARMSPGLHLGTPSLLLYTDRLEQLHRQLADRQVKIGEITEMPTGRVFHFADAEDNYFAVLEKK